MVEYVIMRYSYYDEDFGDYYFDVVYFKDIPDYKKHLKDIKKDGGRNFLWKVIHTNGFIKEILSVKSIKEAPLIGHEREWRNPKCY